MIMPVKIKKRSGEIVNFDSEKIITVIKKTFASQTDTIEKTKIEDLVIKILDEISTNFRNTTPSVEDVQDSVEKNLMKAGYFQVAKSYILYRHEHSRDRETGRQNISENDFYVTKRNGKKERFSLDKLQRSIQYASRGVEQDIDLEKLVKQIKSECYNFITTKELGQAAVLTVRSFIEKDPGYSKVAARLLLNDIYKQSFGEDEVEYTNLAEQYKRAFIKNIYTATKLKRLDPRMLIFDLEKISTLLKPERDDNFKYLGIQTLYDRYLIRDLDTTRILETPQMFWMRVAMGLALNENDPLAHIERFYEVMSTLSFVPSTPTLFHAGTVHPQLSSCYITTVQDSLENIFKSVSDNAQMSKWSGGIGNDWTNIRGTGAAIKGTGVNSQGVIPFLKIANDTTVAINRSGRRRGATCAYLETWHYDIEEFLDLRKNTGDERRRTHDMDTAVWIPDLFMKRVKEDGDWTLFSTEEVPELHHIYGKNFETKYIEYEAKDKAGNISLSKTLKAKDLWKKILLMNFETGHPWITFKDPCNLRSPQDHFGVVHSSNLCTEITLNTSKDEIAVCNLGSINLSQHIAEGKLDKEKIEKTTNVAMRMLDNVIDLNFYPVPEARNSNLRHRPVGLGIMAFQDALYLSDIQFESPKAKEFANRALETISYYSITASMKLAKEKGAYETFPGSKWDRGIMPIDTIDILSQERGIKIDLDTSTTLDWESLKQNIKKHGLRNSNTMAIAPTATIANISGVTQSIEPTYKNLYVKSNVNGDFIVVNEFLVTDLKKINLWNQDIIDEIKFHDGSIKNIEAIPQELRDKYKEVFDIDYKAIVDLAAERGKWIDQSQSLNLYFIGTSGKILSEMYTYAWDKGLKTTYYLRSLGATQVEKSTVSTAKFGTTHTRKQNEDVAIPNLPIPEEPALCKVEDPTCESCQ